MRRGGSYTEMGIVIRSKAQRHRISPLCFAADIGI